MEDKPLNPWWPDTDRQNLRVLGKLAEELGEASAAVARCIIQGIGESEPVTGKANREWLEDELADVLATTGVACRHFRLDDARMQRRVDAKLEHLNRWAALIADPVPLKEAGPVAAGGVSLVHAFLHAKDSDDVLHSSREALLRDFVAFAADQLKNRVLASPMGDALRAIGEGRAQGGVVKPREGGYPPGERGAEAILPTDGVVIGVDFSKGPDITREFVRGQGDQLHDVTTFDTPQGGPDIIRD